MNIFRGLSALPEFQNAVITIGSFDGVHNGHRKILKQVQRLADEIQGTDVVITFHPHPREVIYPKDNDLRILTTLDEKLAYFRQYGVSNVVVVPFTIEFSQQSAQEYIERFLVGRFNPRYIVIGYDHRFGLHRAGNVDLLRLYGRELNFEVVRVEEEEVNDTTISSTRIRRALALNQIEAANDLLGHPYSIMGSVVTGNRLGHHIGYPTANLAKPDPKKLLPGNGIFAATAVVDGISYPGMLYIGLRPSIETAEEEHRIEMHIFDFDRQIYDKEIVIEIHKFIRGDQKFASMEELKNAMAADETAVRSFFNSLSPHIAAVATVILNHNGKPLLERFLPFFTSSLYKNETCWVGDNGSNDGSVRWLKSSWPDVHVLSLAENSGYAGGYNKTLANIQAKYYALVNSDIEVTPGWLLPIIDMMERNPEIAAVQPKILSWHKRTYFEYAGGSGGFMDSLGYPFCRGRILHQLERDTGQYDEPTQIFWASGAAFVIRADVFHEVGGFDADFFAHQEEIDLAWRCLLKGYQIWACPQSIVYHIGGGTLNYVHSQKTYLNFRNNIITLLKYLPKRDLIPVVSLRWALDGLAGFRFLFTGKFSNAFAIIRAHFYIYFHMGKILAKRKEIAASYNRLPLIKLPGVFHGSIIMEYYLQAKRRFSDLFST